MSNEDGRAASQGGRASRTSREIAASLGDLQGLFADTESTTGSGPGSGLIALELTETDLVRDAAYLSHMLVALRRAGVRVVIDDFGTAYASLSYLAARSEPGALAAAC